VRGTLVVDDYAACMTTTVKTDLRLVRAANPIHSKQRRCLVMTKAQEVYEKVEAMVASGEVKKADAFKTLAEQYGQPVDSLRGAYYQHKRVLDSGGNPTASGGGARRTRRRETTSETAVESAITTLRRAIDSIDAEIAVARERAAEAQAEYEAMQASADERKAAIEEKIKLLEPAT
jgi:hypothetical protein